MKHVAMSGLAAAFLFMVSAACAFTPHPHSQNGKTLAQNVGESARASIVTVTALDPQKTPAGNIETTYVLRTERVLSGTPIDAVRLFGGELDGTTMLIGGYPRLELGRRYLVAFVPWGPVDLRSRQSLFVTPMDALETSLVATPQDAIAAMAARAARKTTTPAWPPGFTIGFPRVLHAWESLQARPGWLWDPASPYFDLDNLHGMLNEWNVFGAGGQTLLDVQTITDSIQWGNGRSEYWGVRSAAEIQNFFGYDASNACGVAFSRFSGGVETDVVIVEGCLTADTLLHELGHFLSLDHPFDAGVNMNVASVMDYSCAGRVAAADIHALRNAYPAALDGTPDIVLHETVFSDNPSSLYARCTMHQRLMTNDGEYPGPGNFTIDNPSAQEVTIAGFEFGLSVPPSEWMGTQSPEWSNVPPPYGPPPVDVPMTLPAQSSTTVTGDMIPGLRFGDDTHRLFGRYVVNVRPHQIVPAPTKPAAGAGDIARFSSVHHLGTSETLQPSSAGGLLPFEVGTSSSREQDATALRSAFSVAMEAGDVLEVDYCRDGVVFASASGWGVPEITFAGAVQGGQALHAHPVEDYAPTYPDLGAFCSPSRAQWPAAYVSAETRDVHVVLGVRNEIGSIAGFPAVFAPGFTRLQPWVRLSGERSLVADVSGAGRITSEPAGIDCSQDVCSHAFPLGTQVTLTAQDSPYGELAFWAGECSGNAPTCEVTLSHSTQVYAVFDQTYFGVAVSTQGDGQVTSAPGGILCHPNCYQTYPGGMELTLTATPAPGSRFRGWSGACATVAPTCTFIVTGELGVRAVFDADDASPHVFGDDFE